MSRTTFALVGGNRRSTRHSQIARAAAFTLEDLEVRRMLSTTYDLSSTLLSPDPAPADHFGQNVVTKGNLALVSAFNKTVSGFEQTGQVNLIDTSSGTVLHTFDNPYPDGNIQFGFGLAFVGDKIAISAPQSAHPGISPKVFLYDAATYAPTLELDGVEGSFYGESLASINGDLLIGVPQPGGVLGSAGQILRVDRNSGAAVHAPYSDPFTAPGDSDAVGSFMQVDANTIYTSAIDRSTPTTQQIVIAIDGTTGAISQTFSEPVASPSLQFGSPFTVDLSTHDVFIPDGGIDTVYQFHSNGSLVRSYTDPVTSGEGFGFALAVNDAHQLVVGAQNAYVYADPETPVPNGAAYVFDTTDGSYTATIANPTPQFTTDSDDDLFDAFGSWAAAVPGGKFLISDIYDNNAGGIDAGAVYVFSPHVVVANQPPMAVIAPVAPVNENQTVTLDASGSTDPDGSSDISSYAWDLDNDGQFDDATGATVPFTQDLPGTYTVSVQVTDSVGHTSTASTSVTFNNVAPTANAGPNQAGITGQNFSFSGSGTTAPGDTITTYQWDFNYDGNPAHFNVAATGQNTSHAYASAGTYTVALRVTDDDGETAIGAATVIVTTAPPANTPPTAGPVTGPSSGVRQQTLSFSGSFTDPDLADPHQVSWNFGDGNTIAFHSTSDSGALTPSHVFTATGSYTVTMTVRDSHGATSSSSKVVNISAQGMQGNDLYIGGTTGNDAITVTKSGSGVLVTNGTSTGTFSPSGEIVILGGAGNDVIAVAGAVTNNAFIDGGAGNDLVKGGGGNDILLGGSGSDLLVGDVGRDIQIGGTGSDILTGDAGDDIIIAGTTSWDGNPAGLHAIQSEWLSARTYTQRVNNLRNGTGTPTRNNGTYFVTPDVTAFDDNATDILSGGSGQDWFVYDQDQPNADIIVDLAGTEFASDVDVIHL